MFGHVALTRVQVPQELLADSPKRTEHITPYEAFWEGVNTPSPEVVKHLIPVFAARCRRIGALLSPHHDRNLHEEVQTSRDLVLIGVRDVP